KLDDAKGSTEYRARFASYLQRVQDEDLTLGIAMTDAKGDRSKRPSQQLNQDVYVHVVERNTKGIVITGTKAIVTGAPYVHEFLVMPSRNMRADDKDFALCCAVPVDAPGVTIVARPAGRPGEKPEHGAPLFSRKYGQSTGVVIFDKVFVPWERVFLAGEWEFSGDVTYNYATHHRHSCIAARAGFGDLLIGAGALMCEANGLDPDKKANLRDPMVELIKITEGFYACGVAASVYAVQDPHSRSFMPEPVYSNIGKLLLSTQIYDMHRLAHEVSGGLIVALPGPDEDHNPATAATLAEVLRANPSVPYDKRIEVSRFIEDLTASYQGGWYSLISLHGGGSPTALKQEITGLLAKNKLKGDARIRLTVFRGNGGLYDPGTGLQYLIESWPLEREAGLNSNGLVTGIYPLARKSTDRLAGIKSASFLPYAMAALYAKENKLNDCFVLNTADTIADSTIANLFIRKGNRYSSPGPEQGAVDGVMRRYLIGRMREAGMEIYEEPVSAVQ
ncbi:MAG: aminotransferase class IV, partial [Proteobacteria bacterium]|nr:aminotransferase class IV [Pseudomonadota bacterium]